jgi:hypothetical protein
MKNSIIIIIALIFSNQIYAQYGQTFSELNKYKVCIGVGTGIYWGHARLYSLPRTNNPDERTFAFSASFFKTFSDRVELGVRYAHTDLIGTKSGKSWGRQTLFNTKLDELSLQANISLNKNLFLREEFYTVNLILGAGANYFEAEMKEYPSGTLFSSVGKGRKEKIDFPNKQFAGFGTIGLGFHVRLGQLVSVGIDNYLNITSTKNLTGLTFTSSVNSYDSYSVHLLTIALRLGKGNKLFCPRI